MLSDRLGRGRLLADVRRLQRHLLARCTSPGLRGMPRRVFTYPAGLGLGLAQPGLDHRRRSSSPPASSSSSVRRAAPEAQRSRAAPRNPWNAGTLEWLQPMPERDLGRALDPGDRQPLSAVGAAELRRATSTRARFYLPDAEEGRRETLVTSVLDAEPDAVPARRRADLHHRWSRRSSLGGVFICRHLQAGGCARCGVGAVARARSSYWLWTGTGEIPEKRRKDVGLGLTLPLYASGRDVGRLVGDVHHHDRRRHGLRQPGLRLLLLLDHPRRLPADRPRPARACSGRWLALALFVVAWARDARRARAEPARRPGGHARGCCSPAALAGARPAAARCSPGPGRTGLDPDRPCLSGDRLGARALDGGARRASASSCSSTASRAACAGRLTPGYDIDICNVALYWHFLAITALVTFAIVALFPTVAGGGA